MITGGNLLGHFGTLSIIIVQFFSDFPTDFQGDLGLGVVHKLRLQDEVGRWSKNVYFLSMLDHTKCQRRGVGGQEKPKSCQRSL